MPAGEYQFGDGTILEVSDGVAGAFVAVIELESLTPPAHDTGSLERKRLSQTSIVEMVPNSRVKIENSTFQYELTDAITARLNTLVIAKFASLGPPKTYYAWRVTLPDGLRFAFQGYLQSAKPGQVQGGAIVMGTGTIAPTSLITISDTIP